MKKNLHLARWWSKNDHLRKILMTMKLTVFFIILAMGSTMADVGYSQSTRLSLNLNDVTVKEVLNQIESKSEFFFMYNSKLVDVERIVTVKVENQRIDEILNQLFLHTNVVYKLIDRQIVLTNTVDQADFNELVESKLKIKVTGVVVDKSSRAPLPGVNILIQGTKDGCITDLDGNFVLEVPDANSVLVFSFIGYQTQTHALEGKVTIEVLLEEETKGLEEVVVTGYGTQKKETLTGSVVHIGGEEIRKSPLPNVTSSLTGKLSGLVVNQRSGEPGKDDPSILIRGTGTFVSDPSKIAEANAPLIIIDGVQRSLMSRLNPEDIESVSVLKDASAAIYGARAANGVIIITTKKGATGKPLFDFSINYALQSPTKVSKVLDAVTFAEAFNEGDWYKKGRPDKADYVPFYSDDAIQKFRDGTDPVLYPNTNWVGEVMKPYSLQRRMNLQVTGGSEAVRYLVSFGTLNQDGNYQHNPTDYKQYNLRSKIDVNLTKNLSVGANIYTILNQKTYSPVATNVNFVNILHSNPTLIARYPNGLIAPGRLGENPLLLDQRGTDKIEEVPLFSTFTASYAIPFVTGLKIDGSFNYDINNQLEKKFSLPYYYYEYNVNTKEYDRKQGTGASTVELWDTYRKWTTMLYNIKMVYDKTFDKHHLTAMMGQEQQKNTYTFAEAYRKNFVSSAIDQINVGGAAPEDKGNSGSATASAYNNYFGRLNYDFSSKYLFEFLFRYDGSQIFPEGKRYGFFPGFSAGWRLSEEKFIRNNLPFVNQLKLRVSIGQIGNDRVDQYQYLQSFSFGDNYVFGANDVPGIYANTMPNPNITWEVSKKTDVGLETSLWNGFLGMEITLWKENRSNILAQRNLSIPNIYGFSGLPSENIGKVYNHGFEVVLRHKNTIDKLIYNIDATASFARSNIKFMDETPQAEYYQNQTGHPVGASLFYQADGIFNTQEELDSFPHSPSSQLGDIKIIDMNNDGKINAKDQFRFNYTATPEYVFGLNMSFQYQNFDLSIFFQGQTNAYNYDGEFAKLGNSAFDNAIVDRAKNRWTVDNPNGTMPRSDSWQPGNTTFFLYDATFIRLKTLEFGYSLPANIASKLKLKDFRLYVNGFNLLTWAKEIKWADPEMSGDFLYYPQLRIINLGVSIKF